MQGITLALLLTTSALWLVWPEPQAGLAAAARRPGGRRRRMMQLNWVAQGSRSKVALVQGSIAQSLRVGSWGP